VNSSLVAGVSTPVPPWTRGFVPETIGSPVPSPPGWEPITGQPFLQLIGWRLYHSSPGPPVLEVEETTTPPPRFSVHAPWCGPFTSVDPPGEDDPVLVRPEHVTGAQHDLPSVPDAACWKRRCSTSRRAW